MDIPNKPYIALYGSHSGNWRERCAELLERHEIAYYDPTDPGWNGIDEHNGDRLQDRIDRLVKKQHEGLLRSVCVIYHLANQKQEYLNDESFSSRDPDGEHKPAPAARCELGFLTGRGLRTFGHIEGDVVGRNYLWAQMKLYPHMTACSTLRQASEQAIAYFQTVR